MPHWTPICWDHPACSLQQKCTIHDCFNLLQPLSSAIQSAFIFHFAIAVAQHRLRVLQALLKLPQASTPAAG